LVFAQEALFAKTSTHILPPRAFAYDNLGTTTQYLNIGKLNPSSTQVSAESPSPEVLTEIAEKTGGEKRFTTSPTTPKDS
jgi:hypothetical protein